MRERSVRAGREAEAIVAQDLVRRGWRILGRNLRWVGTELDLVARLDSTLAVVEVKSAGRPAGWSQLNALLPTRKRKALERGLDKAWGRFACDETETIRLDLAVVDATDRIFYYLDLRLQDWSDG